MSFLSSLLSNNESKPKGERSVVDPDLRNTLPIAMASPLTRTIRTLYSIFLIDYSGSSTSIGSQGAAIVEFPEGTGADPAGKRSIAEFNFSVPPRAIDEGEPYATDIQYTQGGGKLVESQGSIVKDIRIQGTTGVRPNTDLTDVFGIRNAGEVLNQIDGVSSLLGGNEVIDAGLSIVRGADRLTGVGSLSNNEITGQDDFIFLRNIFRLYSDLKKSGDAGAQIAMVWSNQKDGEYWIVEPKEFRGSRNASNPLSYDYQITFTTLAKYEVGPNKVFDLVSEIRSAKKFAERIKDYTRVLFNTYQDLTTNRDKLGGLPINVDTLVLLPMGSVINTLAATALTSRKIKAQLRTQTQELSENLQIALDAIRSTNTSSGSAISTLEVQNSIERNLRRAQQTTSSILSEQTVSKSVIDAVTDRRVALVNAYNKGGVGSSQRLPPRTGGDPTFLGNQQLGAGVAQSFVHEGEDIFAVAARLLKDDRLWKSIVVLNQLKSPYVSNTPADGVLVPGDAVLYPVPVSQGMNSSAISAYQADGEEADTRDTDPLEVAYGRDLRLFTDNTTGRDLTDVVVNQRGDLGSIQGVDNVTQGMRLKFSTERGELPAHPNYGAKYALGSRATITSVNLFKIDVRGTILSDPRVSLINKLRFVTSGDLMGVEADITLVDTNSILQTSFAVRRF